MSDAEKLTERLEKIAVDLLDYAHRRAIVDEACGLLREAADALRASTPRDTVQQDEAKWMHSPEEFAYHLGAIGWDSPRDVQWSKATQFWREITAHVRSRPPQHGWQPIEKAPKDGTMILVYTPDPSEPIAAVTWEEYDIEYWHVHDRKFEPRPLRRSAPTHWMPLPAAPDQEG